MAAVPVPVSVRRSPFASASTVKALPSGVEAVSRSAPKTIRSVLPSSVARCGIGPAVPPVLLVAARSRNIGAFLPPAAAARSSVPP